jgi:hypothetical protein
MWAASLVACFAGCAARGADPAEQCAKLREHLSSLRAGSVPGTSGERAGVELAMQRALGDDFVTSCTANMTASQVECSLSAKDLVSASWCVQPH